MRRRSELHSIFDNLSPEEVGLEAAFENIEPGPQRASLEHKLRNKMVSCKSLGISGQGPCSAAERIPRSGASCGSDRETLLRDIASAGQHIAQSDAHISKQEALIAELDRDGHDTTVARALLDTMRDMRVLHLQHRGRILTELAR
jgi:hypothetical protein